MIPSWALSADLGGGGSSTDRQHQRVTWWVAPCRAKLRLKRKGKGNGIVTDWAITVKYLEQKKKVEEAKQFTQTFDTFLSHYSHSRCVSFYPNVRTSKRTDYWSDKDRSACAEPHSLAMCTFQTQDANVFGAEASSAQTRPLNNTGKLLPSFVFVTSSSISDPTQCLLPTLSCPSELQMLQIHVDWKSIQKA